MRTHIYSFLFAVAIFSACEDQPAPQVMTFMPDFGPAETLITVEGMDFDNLLAINFNNGLAADFNPSFGTGEALLFRVPEGAELGDHTIEIITEGGSTDFQFRVTQKPPTVSEFFPESASVGETVTILGENFFEPIEVLFFDSVAANVVFLAEDSMIVEVPENATKGQIRVKANGGSADSPKAFFSVVELLVNDFDGNGIRSETDKWIFRGFLNEDNSTAIQNMIPIPVDNNFLKISGQADTWIGSIQSHFNDEGFEHFDITTDINNTFVEFDANNNGREATHIFVSLREVDRPGVDFSFTMDLDQTGWNNYRISLNRILDFAGATINPQKINIIKFDLVNANNSAGLLELNIDNIKFIQIK